MKKDLKYLNSKWWYRLLKVLYVFVFLISLTVSTIVVFSNFKPKLNLQKSYAICLETGQIVKIDDKSYLGNYEIIRETCASSIAATKPEYEKVKNLTNLTKEQFNQRYGFIPGEHIQKNYELHLVSDPRDWNKIITKLVICAAGIFLFLELIRRIFYYILTGTFFPKKEE